MTIGNLAFSAPRSSQALHFGGSQVTGSTGALYAILPQLLPQFVGVVDQNVYGGLAGCARLQSGVAVPVNTSRRIQGGDAPHTHRTTGVIAGPARPENVGALLLVGAGTPVRVESQLVRGRASALNRTKRLRTPGAAFLLGFQRLAFSPAKRFHKATHSSTLFARFLSGSVRSSFSFGRLQAVRTRGTWQETLFVPGSLRVPWHAAKRPPTGRGNPPPVAPEPAPRVIGKLDFRCPAIIGGLHFGSPCFGSGPWLVFPRRSYYVQNDVAITRVIDQAEIPARAVFLATDLDSWTWRVTLTLPNLAAARMLNGNPTEIEITVNGFTWRAIVERPNENRVFSQQGATADGVSLSGWLAAPYAPVRSRYELTVKTAHQLALDELPQGWAIDWLIDDWTVPAETFSYSGLAPIDAIQRIASAAGAVVQASPDLQRVSVIRRWKQPPWNWAAATPDATLAADYVASEGKRYSAKPNFNAAMAYGVDSNGVLVRAVIDGTAGDVAAEDVQDALIVDPLVGRDRAIQALSDGYPLRSVALSMGLRQVPAGAGLILPGTLIDVDESGEGYRGLTDSVEISANVDGGGFVDVVQTVGMLTDG